MGGRTCLHQADSAMTVSSGGWRVLLEVGVTHSTVTSRTIAVEHIRIESGKTFEDVRRALEETIPKLNPAVGEFLRKGDQERAKAEEEHGPKLSIFLDRVMVPCSASPAVLATRASKKSAIRGRHRR